MTAPSDPHHGITIRRIGTALKDSTGALILLHGRGASAADILALGREIAPRGMALIAPEADGNTWYPNSFLAPIARNEPWLSSALRAVAKLVDECLAEGMSGDRIVIAGFSQGACLSTEYAARNPRRYAAVLAFTGGLIGPPGAALSHAGDLAGTPVLLSSGDPDPHVPWERVEQTASALRAMGAAVTANRYPGRPHTVLPEEAALARAMLNDMFKTKEMA